ncbi:hypothetical protein Pmani_026424 [Petrolisthes manimaculis]|uniref:Uncharacterized protein n=1 Tax=Petrolisthes manimaculis TaxID=1843537 RepID=A0AAE1P5U5_9EUCA|nr:hypothetical protein Pmani_026424 [Petrolisthes manimaculis]
MVRTVSFALLVLVVVSAVFVHGHDLKYPEREMVSELAGQILSVVQGGQGGAAMSPQLPPPSASKRNAELINSLLGLPQVMTNAGRR